MSEPTEEHLPSINEARTLEEYSAAVSRAFSDKEELHEATKDMPIVKGFISDDKPEDE